MKELRQILKRIEEADSGEKLLLATVVEVKGSSYRLPGAKMLIDASDNVFGMISGGCLEADILERSKQLREKGEPMLFLYDTTKNDESVFSLNMGCQGIIRVFLEPINKDSLLFKALSSSVKARKSLVVATVVDSADKTLVGKRVFCDQEKTLEGTDGSLANLEAKAKKFFQSNENACLKQEKVGETECEVFYEKILPPLKLLVFGAGYDAISLVEIASSIGWSVSVVDYRPAFATKERFPTADEIKISRAEHLDDAIFHGENVACIIMTHNYEQDRLLLNRALRSDCFYVGLLGPKKRAERLLEELGEKFSDEEIAKLYSPVGLDIGAKTPETIALSIIAEIEAVSNGRCGGFLRDRKGSIYGRY